jgi:hypothetical protein
MRHYFCLSVIVAGIVLFALVSLVSAQGRTLFILTGPEAVPVGTAFTYQGYLANGGAPVNSICDFQFGLWDANSNGTQIGATLTKSSVGVGGKFMVQLDFGSGAFTGDARWLEISTRCPAGSGAYTLLSPRQALAPAPYALALPGLYTEQSATSPNLIGGYKGNTVTTGAVGATIGGGGSAAFVNRVTDDYGTVSGGQVNRAGDNAGTTSDKSWATVSGGAFNVAGGQNAAVGGGWSNSANGYAATVPGGTDNSASQNYSFAAGHRAKSLHAGTFVWADSTNADYASTATNQFAIRASNGISLAINAGEAKTIDIGERYRDNAIVAWAKILGTGIGSIQSEFGVDSVEHNNTGSYRIYLDVSAADAGSLIPIAIAEVDSAPVSAASVRIVSINQVATNSFIVYINNGNWQLVDNDFVFMATAR